jgi:hypothetical protein
MLQFWKVAAPGISCLFAVVSCFCWIRSVAAKVEYSADYYDGKNSTQTEIEWTEKCRIDLRRTAELRGKWNAFAAAAASVAAFFQALTLWFGI